MSLTGRLTRDAAKQMFREVANQVDEKSVQTVVYDASGLDSFDRKVVVESMYAATNLAKRGVRYGIVFTSPAVRFAVASRPTSFPGTVRDLCHPRRDPKSG